MTENHTTFDFADQIRQDEFPDFMSLETIAREKFLIEHGVRHFVICGYFEGHDHKMASMYAMLRRVPSYVCGEVCAPAIPFVIKSAQNSGAVCGYASHPWIIETFEYVHNHAEGVHHSRLEGLLLGYHPDAIEADGQMFCGRRFRRSQARTETPLIDDTTRDDVPIPKLHHEQP